MFDAKFYKKKDSYFMSFILFLMIFNLLLMIEKN